MPSFREVYKGVNHRIYVRNSSVVVNRNVGSWNLYRGANSQIQFAATLQYLGGGQVEKAKIPVTLGPFRGELLIAVQVKHYRIGKRGKRGTERLLLFLFDGTPARTISG